MIPADQLNQAQLTRLLLYLQQEITRTLSDRKPLEEKWLEWQRLYKCIPLRSVKEFPFYGAANLELPVGATDVDIVVARLLGLLFEPGNLWSCKPLRPDALLYAPRLQEFLQWAQDAELGVFEAVRDFIIETCKLGTGVLKQRYERRVQEVYEFRETPQGVLQQFANVLVKNSPRIEHVSLFDFLVPATATADQATWPWCAERITLNWGQLQERVQAGIYMGTDRLAAWNARDRGSWLLEQYRQMDNFVPSLARQFELWEVWTKFDIRGNGRPVSVVCTLHLPTMTYLRVDFNPFFHQEYPFSVARYLAQEKRFYGIGLMEMDEPAQVEISTIHNQRLDNHTIANAPMMKARKGIGIREEEPIIPGRWVLVDSMDDVEPMTLGRNFDSSIQDEEMTASYYTRRTGVNDYVQGASSAAIGYAAAYTNVMQTKEASKRFDQVLREVRTALTDSGRRSVELYQQFDQQGKEYMVMGQEDGEMVHQVLQFPLELIRHSVLIEVTATNASLNKEVEIRTNTILMQLHSQFGMQAVQALMMAFNPQLPEPLRMLIIEFTRGGMVLMRRLLDAYGIQDIEEILPRMEALFGSSQQSGIGLAQPAPFGAGGGSPGFALQPPGMAALPPGAGGQASAGFGRPPQQFGPVPGL